MNWPLQQGGDRSRRRSRCDHRRGPPRSSPCPPVGHRQQRHRHARSRSERRPPFPGRLSSTIVVPPTPAARRQTVSRPRLRSCRRATDRDVRSRLRTLGNNPRLLVIRPVAPPSPSRNQLDPPIVAGFIPAFRPDIKRGFSHFPNPAPPKTRLTSWRSGQLEKVGPSRRLR